MEARVSIWLVCGQRLSQHGGGLVDVRSTYKATQHFMEKALVDERRAVGESGVFFVC